MGRREENPDSQVAGVAKAETAALGKQPDNVLPISITSLENVHVP